MSSYHFHLIGFHYVQVCHNYMLLNFSIVTLFLLFIDNHLLDLLTSEIEPGKYAWQHQFKSLQYHTHNI